MPRRPAPPITTLIRTVEQVSPAFARVAELARFGLALQAAMAMSGYELRQKKKLVEPVVENDHNPAEADL